jgi:hypothetical protein
MKIRIITSCTGEKRHSPANRLLQVDFKLGRDSAAFVVREAELAEYRTRAEDIYTGQQHMRLMRGVQQARTHFGSDVVQLWILSAGYGLIKGDRQVVPYECSFQGMKRSVLRSWADELQVPAHMRAALAPPYDLGLILLGDDYMDACKLDASMRLGGPTLIFSGSNMANRLPQLEDARIVVLSNREASRFHVGLVALKGEIATLLLARLAEKPSLREQLFDPAVDVLTLLEVDASGPTQEAKPAARSGKPDATIQKPTANKERARPNAAVDHVIQIPGMWWDKPHRQKLRYFIPEWDDLVDPDYDFEADTHSGGTSDWSNEVYAHQMYPEPNYDGILVSKVVAEKSKKKKERINALGVHRYLRVPPEFPIMGDCGAFGYIMEEKPPYTTDEILDYYTRLGFNYGVSIDHLIVTATEEQKQFRYDLTIHNAEEFLREHRKRGLAWEPVGAVQGWDPKSYAEAARQYVAMGYRYIGLGGLVRTSTPDILRILEVVHVMVPESVSVHLFGLARLRAISEFVRMGVRSVDSASYLRQAWMRGAQGYLLDTSTYASLRIPEVGKSFRAKRMVERTGVSVERLSALEQASIRSVRALATHQCSVDECLNALLEYDRLISTDRADMSALYRRTLEERPWELCGCDICRASGIEVMIFRGNNRNRRRGFHNTYVFYRLLQRLLTGEDLGITGAENAKSEQLSLFATPGESSDAL